MVGSPYSEKEASHLSSTQEENQEDNTQVGIEIPTSVEHAFELKRKNGKNLWKEALEMEMYSIGVAFEILQDGKTAPAGYTKVSGHLIWSVLYMKSKMGAGWPQNT